MKSTVLASLVAAFAVPALVPACGSDPAPIDQAPVECGPGTVLSGGVCVLPEAGDSDAQIADSTVDEAFSDLAPVPDGDNPDVEPPMDASEASDSTEPDAEQDAEGGTGENEPCLPAYTMNCTFDAGEPSCSPGAVECAPHVCQQNAYKVQSLPFTMRMPSGLMPVNWDCVACSAYATEFTVLLRIDVAPDPNTVLRIRVGEPWEIVINPLTELSHAFCDRLDSVTDCLVTDANTGFYVAIATYEDAAALNRNVTIEQVPVGSVCP